MSDSELALPRPGARAIEKREERRLPSAATHVLDLLDGVPGGLEFRLPDGQHLRVGAGTRVAGIEVRDWRVFETALARGDIGFAEAYVDGWWESEDLVALLMHFAANRDTLTRLIHGRALQLIGYRLRHWLNANTRAGSKRNIMAHYDLGNAFYKLWLDASMSYSAGLYEGTQERSLEYAQRAKYRRILSCLNAQPGARVLEIGCGWGGFAELAANESALDVHGLTLSPAQLAYARARADSRGFAERARFELCDYRDCQGQYDHIVSIEMFEAVGERYWPAYFAKLAQLLAPGGRAVVQVITIADELFARYRRGTDFIQRYIFPGGMLPSPTAFRRAAARAGLRVSGEFAFGPDYARTLAEWRARFEDMLPAVRAQGFGEDFIRLWRFYLAYCEAGFAAGSTDVYHFELEHA